MNRVNVQTDNVKLHVGYISIKNKGENKEK